MHMVKRSLPKVCTSDDGHARHLLEVANMCLCDATATDKGNAKWLYGCFIRGVTDDCDFRIHGYSRRAIIARSLTYTIDR